MAQTLRSTRAPTVGWADGCRNEDLDRAVSDLRVSADVRPDYRLSSSGPSLDPVREVCAGGRWEEGLDYLRVWKEHGMTHASASGSQPSKTADFPKRTGPRSKARR